MHMGLGEYDMARDMFQDSSDYVGDHPRTWYNMGVCYAFLMDWRKAIESFRKVWVD